MPVFGLKAAKKRGKLCQFNKIRVSIYASLRISWVFCLIYVRISLINLIESVREC